MLDQPRYDDFDYTYFTTNQFQYPEVECIEFGLDPNFKSKSLELATVSSAAILC